MTKFASLQAAADQIEKIIGHRFSRKELLTTAFTHKSVLNEMKTNTESNERLEFFGDAVLNLYISEQLYQLYPNYNEGQLSQMKARLISEESFQKIIEKNGLHTYLVMGRGEVIRQTQLLPSVQADLLEAIFGAIFIDAGLSGVQAAAKTLLGEDFFSSTISKAHANPKAELQELAAQAKIEPPEYTLLEETGAHHKKVFVFSVSISGKRLGRGQGSSKKEAEKEAAKNALIYISTHGLPL